MRRLGIVILGASMLAACTKSADKVGDTTGTSKGVVAAASPTPEASETPVWKPNLLADSVLKGKREAPAGHGKRLVGVGPTRAELFVAPGCLACDGVVQFFHRLSKGDSVGHRVDVYDISDSVNMARLGAYAGSVKGLPMLVVRDKGLRVYQGSFPPSLVRRVLGVSDTVSMGRGQPIGKRVGQ